MLLAGQPIERAVGEEMVKARVTEDTRLLKETATPRFLPADRVEDVRPAVLSATEDSLSQVETTEQVPPI